MYMLLPLKRGTLKDLYKTTPLRAVLDILVRVAKALVVLHKLGIIHRDFKSDNVLV